MKVNDFLDRYRNLETEEDKKAYIYKIIKKDFYLPYVQKINLCESIVRNTSLVDDENGRKRVKINSPAKFMLYIMNVIDQYTELEIDLTASTAIYDDLHYDKLVDRIVSEIDENEVKELKFVLDMCFDDFMQNKYHIANFVHDEVSNFANLLGDKLSPAINTLADSVNNIDEEKAMKLVNKIKKQITK